LLDDRLGGETHRVRDGQSGSPCWQNRRCPSRTRCVSPPRRSSSSRAFRGRPKNPTAQPFVALVRETQRFVPLETTRCVLESCRPWPSTSASGGRLLWWMGARDYGFNSTLPWRHKVA